MFSNVFSAHSRRGVTLADMVSSGFVRVPTFIFLRKNLTSDKTDALHRIHFKITKNAKKL